MSFLFLLARRILVKAQRVLPHFEVFSSLQCAVASIDLGSVAFKMEHKENWEPGRIAKAIIGYRQFLVLSHLHPHPRYEEVC
jgi:hypothetical protein